MSALVYQAINAVAAELAENGIAKSHRNEEGDYAYRSIEDVLASLAPLLARHSLCILPRVIERNAMRASRASQLVTVRAAFDLVSALDGSSHKVESFGEALDDSDKGTAKAMSAAYKAAMLQAFCIPVPPEDTDTSSPRLNGTAGDKLGRIALSEPVEGWESWAGEVIHIAKSCESAEAIDRLTNVRQSLLAALQRARPELYATIGEAIAARLAELQRPSSPKAGQGGAPLSDAGASGQAHARAIEPVLVPDSRSDERRDAQPKPRSSGSPDAGAAGARSEQTRQTRTRKSSKKSTDAAHQAAEAA